MSLMCEVVAMLLKDGDDPPEWFMTLGEVSDSGLCLLGDAAYRADLDSSVWEGSYWSALLCVEHAARLRQVGGVVRMTDLPTS